MASDIDAELEAIKTLQAALEPLRPEVRARVLDYVFRVLEIAQPAAVSAAELRTAAPTFTAPVLTAASPRAVTDIFSLKQQKKPTSANQMIALVAYYLSHAAPDAERKEAITAADVRKYFVQGKYPMPNSLPQALVNARNAGYLDLVDRGTYRLNSVGYNLVEHKLGEEEGGALRQVPKRGKRKAKKGSRR